MIVHNLHILGTGISPAKANAPLIIDAYAVLAPAFPLQRLKMIPGPNAEVFKPISDL